MYIYTMASIPLICRPPFPQGIPSNVPFDRFFIILIVYILLWASQKSRSELYRYIYVTYTQEWRGTKGEGRNSSRNGQEKRNIMPGAGPSRSNLFWWKQNLIWKQAPSVPQSFWWEPVPGAFWALFSANSMGLLVLENSILPHSSFPSKHMGKVLNWHMFCFDGATLRKHKKMGLPFLK